MSGFDWDEMRRDPAFRAVMRTAETVKASCDKGDCHKCPYRRRDEMLVVCYTEKLADALIEKDLIKR